MVESMRKSFVQGWQSPALELGLITDWGFELEGLDGKGLMMWHGRADINTPCLWQRKL